MEDLLTRVINHVRGLRGAETEAIKPLGDRIILTQTQMPVGGSTHSKNMIWDLRSRENEKIIPRKLKTPHIESTNHLRILSKPSK